MTKDKYSWEVFLFPHFQKKILRLLTSTTKKLLPWCNEVTVNQVNMLQKSVGFFRGFPPPQVSLAEKLSSTHSCALDISFIIIHWKFPMQTEGNFFSNLQNGNFFCPKPNHMNLVRYKKAGEIIFSTTYRVVESSAGTAVDHFRLYLPPLKLEI